MLKITTNEKGAGRQSSPFNKSPTNGHKSTATAAQHDRILRMLRTGEKSTFDFRRAGIMAPAARIKELNAMDGYYLPTIALRDLYDEHGFRHCRVAIYELVNEPIKAKSRKGTK